MEENNLVDAKKPTLSELLMRSLGDDADETIDRMEDETFDEFDCGSGG